MNSNVKKVLGLLAPMNNTAIVNDFCRLVPENVELRVGRLFRDSKRTPYQRLLDMGEHLEESLGKLGEGQIDLVAFGCTGGSFVGGFGYDRELAARITKFYAGAESSVAATAVLEALNVLDAKQISVCSPYSGEWEFVNGYLKRFYEDAGLEILEIGSTQPGEPLTTDSAIEISKSVDHPGSDAIFISCTDFSGALEAVDAIEAVLGKPVVTSNQATFWYSIQKLGVSTPRSAGGVLLRDGVSLKS